MAALLQKQLQAERKLYPSRLLQLLNLGNFILTSIGGKDCLSDKALNK